MSSELEGTTVDLHAVTDGKSRSGVEHGERLVAFAEAAVAGSDAELDTARQALLEAVGPAKLVDAAAVIGNFQRMVRIADSTGIPLDTPVAALSADVREDLGIDEFGSSANTPKLGLLARLAARAARPLLNPVLRLVARIMMRGSGRRDASRD